MRFEKKLGDAMDRDKEYRRLAADALRLAESARNERDRAQWLRLAHAWLDLTSVKKGKAERAFDKEVTAKGTGQDPSTSSH